MRALPVSPGAQAHTAMSTPRTGAHTHASLEFEDHVVHGQGIALAGADLADHPILRG